MHQGLHSPIFSIYWDFTFLFR